MENINQTSFIPKQAVSPVVSRVPKAVSGLSLIAWFLFFVSLISAVGSFLWNKTLESNISSMKQKIASIQLDENVINDIKELDKRIISSEEIMNSHIAVSPIFEILQRRTLRTVSFNKFSYSVTDPSSGSRSIVVNMTGRAKSYDSIAQQSEELTKSEYIINPVFSNMTLDEIRGVISFDLSFGVSPALVSYEAIFNSKNQGFNLIN